MGQLERTGGSNFFTDASLATMGRFRGGSAKMAVVGSTLFGRSPASPPPNVVAVGIVTIPLMKRSGMSAAPGRRDRSVRVERRPVMPPVMGAVAFVMAEFLQFPYQEVAIAAILPSVMYYAALFIQSDLEAARYGFGKVEEAKIPRIGRVLAQGAGCSWCRSWCWIYTMFWLNLEPEYAAMAGKLSRSSCSAFAFGYDGQRMKLRDLWSARGGGPRAALCEILVHLRGRGLHHGASSR